MKATPPTAPPIPAFAAVDSPPLDGDAVEDDDEDDPVGEDGELMVLVNPGNCIIAR
jgi:hypothetical protein